jgi:hypothetical protein
MSHIWEERMDLKGAELYCAIAIADHADNDGKCFPGLVSIAKKMRCTVRHIEGLISRLEAKKVFRIERGSGRGHKTVFQFLKGEQPFAVSETLKDEQSFALLDAERANNPSPIIPEKGRTIVQERANNCAKNSAHIRNESFKPSIYTREVENKPLALPTSVDSEVTSLLAMVAPLLGAKSVRTMDDEFRWRKVCEKVVAEQHQFEAFLSAVRSEVKRCHETPQFLTPEGCLKKLQTSTVTTSDGWAH